MIKRRRYIRANSDFDTLKNVAKTTTDESEMLELTRNPDENIRYFLVKNPNLTEKVLMQLMQDDDSSIRWRVARHKNVTPKILSFLANDPDPDVRVRVAINDDTPSNILDQMADDSDEYVLLNIAVHPNASIETLKKILKQNNKYASVASAIKDRLSEIKSSTDIYADVGSLSTPEEMQDAENRAARYSESERKANTRARRAEWKSNRPIRNRPQGSLSNPDGTAKFRSIDDDDYVAASLDFDNDWEVFKDLLAEDCETSYDPIYDLTECGEYLSDICMQVEEELGIWGEPSVQGGNGFIEWMTIDGDEPVGSSSCPGINLDIVDLAFDANSEQDFINMYREYLEDELGI